MNFNKTNRLLTIADAESLDIDEVWGAYRSYVSRSQVDLIGSFLFGRELAKYSEGCYIYTKERKILDLTGGIGVLNHGHNHPRILAARLQLKVSEYKIAVNKSLKTLIPASTALVFTVPMVQVFLNTTGGGTGYETMPIALANGVADLAGQAWPFFSTFIGGLGAFVAGSNTVSNMMFSQFQFSVGQQIMADPTWIVALQAVGGASGNIICVHNVVAASAVAGIIGREGAVIRKTLLPFFYYALISGSIGYGIVNMSSGIFNLGFIIAGLIVATMIYFIHRFNRSASG